MKKMIRDIVFIIFFTFLVWIVFSWSEIVFNNTCENPSYSEHNFFTLVTK